MFYVKRDDDSVIIKKVQWPIPVTGFVKTIPALGNVLWDYGFTELQIERVLNAFDDGITTVNIQLERPT